MGWKSGVAKLGLKGLRPVISALGAPARRKADLAPPSSRQRFIDRIPTDRGALEIGPFYCPQLRGEGIFYFDVLDRDELIERARALGMDPSSCPEIQFVSKSADLGSVDRRFGAVFSSHCLEHQPDLVEHLNQVERLLEPGGSYFLIIPDKRYCFDHFLAESHVGEIYEASVERRRHHTAGSIMSHRLMLTHNNALLHWLGIHGKKPSAGLAQLSEAAAESKQSLAGEYIDVHAWYFTPRSFQDTIHKLRMLGLIRLELSRLHDTGFGDQEFFAVLTKPAISEGSSG